MSRTWSTPTVDEVKQIQTGDMPGDKVQIEESHIEKAKTIMTELEHLVPDLFNQKDNKIVISVHGGSGVGKSEIGSLIGYYLKETGINSYILSGDNYPHRIPADNDAERKRHYEEYGLKGLVSSGEYSQTNLQNLQDFQKKDQDTDPALLLEFPWMKQYQDAGKEALKGYLGTPNEIDFHEVSEILQAFKNGATEIYLKRMGRTKDVFYYDSIDFTDVQVLIVEWTHGNNDHLLGVDYPILLNSTPEETLAHRRKRNRDGGVDSPFTTLVLSIEQQLLFDQSHRAKIIVSKNGDLLTHDQLKKTMK